jgi:hypothetical protein
VSLEVLAGDHLAPRVEPRHLTETRPRSEEMWRVDGARLVVVRQMADCTPVAVDLDDGERGIGQGIDAGPRPGLGGDRVGREADTEGDGEADRPSKDEQRALHVVTPPRSVSRPSCGSQCREIDTAVDSGP